MNLRYITKYVALAFLCALQWTAIYAQDEAAEDQEESSSPGVVVDEIIAKVDNYIILKSELENTYINYLANGNPATSDARCRILAQLISQKLMVAKAEIDSVIVTDEEVDGNLDRRMQMILSQYGGSAEQLEQYYGKTVEELQADLRDQVKEQLVVQRMQETITADIKITPSEVKKFFGKIAQDSLPYFSTEVEVAQIVKIPEVGEVQIDAARKKLSEIRRKVLAGEAEFEAMAKEFSQDPGSAKYGGNLGFAQRGMMAPEFEAAALKLKPGEISAPFTTQFGVHIVQLIERRGNEYNSRHILISAEPSAEDMEIGYEYLDSLRTVIIADSISFTKAAKEYSDDMYTAGSGGFFTDNNEGIRVSSEELDPVIFFALDSMQIGDISKPIKFRTDNGKQAIRILYYKSKVKPHQANLKDDWQKIQAAALNEKKNRAINKWFDGARDDVFISIDEEYNYCGILN